MDHSLAPPGSGIVLVLLHNKREALQSLPVFFHLEQQLTLCQEHPGVVIVLPESLLVALQGSLVVFQLLLSQCLVHPEGDVLWILAQGQVQEQSCHLISAHCQEDAPFERLSFQAGLVDLQRPVN